MEHDAAEVVPFMQGMAGQLPADKRDNNCRVYQVIFEL